MFALPVSRQVNLHSYLYSSSSISAHNRLSRLFRQCDTSYKYVAILAQVKDILATPDVVNTYVTMVVSPKSGSPPTPSSSASRKQKTEELEREERVRETTGV